VELPAGIRRRVVWWIYTSDGEKPASCINHIQGKIVPSSVSFTPNIHVSLKLCFQSARLCIAADTMSILTAGVTCGIAVKSF
jgi:hypothetical protein